VTSDLNSKYEVKIAGEVAELGDLATLANDHCGTRAATELEPTQVSTIQLESMMGVGMVAVHLVLERPQRTHYVLILMRRATHSLRAIAKIAAPLHGSSLLRVNARFCRFDGNGSNGWYTPSACRMLPSEKL
jgi:hypothetical protein